METNTITVTDALKRVYTMLCMLTVQGPENARILASACDDLKVIVQTIENGGEKSDDTNKDATSNG